MFLYFSYTMFNFIYLNSFFELNINQDENMLTKYSRINYDPLHGFENPFFHSDWILLCYEFSMSQLLFHMSKNVGFDVRK